MNLELNLTFNLTLSIILILILIGLYYLTFKNKNTTINEPFLMKLDFPENKYFKIKIKISNDLSPAPKIYNKQKNKKSKGKVNDSVKNNDETFYYLDVQFDHANDITKPILVPPSNSLGQQWYQKDGKIYNRLNHLVLSVYQDVKADGIPLFLTVSRNTNGQYWIIDDLGVIRSRLNGGRMSYSKNNDNIVIKLSSSRVVEGYLQYWNIEITNELVEINPVTPSTTKPDINTINQNIKQSHKLKVKNMLEKLKKIV